MCSDSFYDILVYSKSLEEHLHHPQLVLQLLAQDKWQVKRSKCSFAQGKIVCLGHVISTEGVSIDPKKIVAIQSWPTPENLTHLRSFLGLVGYYKKFVKNFGVICKPLTELLKKKNNVHFGFSTSASILCSQGCSGWSTCVVLPDFTKQFQVEIDVSDVGLGALLM
jgi:hypothetical protein